MKFFDPSQNRLIFMKERADANFWDDHWQSDNNIIEKIKKAGHNDIVVTTEKYLRPADGQILEGGCGSGINVAALTRCGYQTIGVDYAPKTVDWLRQNFSELDIRLGDVRKLPFADNFFAGYWSLGVIEHFWDGYDEIAVEMARVIKPGGYLFLTFPVMSCLRGVKSKLKFYEIWQKGKDKSNFYQFALDSKKVEQDFRHFGLVLVKKNKISGLKGFKDEVEIFKPALQRLYDYRGRWVFWKALRRILSLLLSPMANHCVLLVFKKTVDK